MDDVDLMPAPGEVVRVRVHHGEATYGGAGEAGQDERYPPVRSRSLLPSAGQAMPSRVRGETVGVQDRPALLSAGTLVDQGVQQREVGSHAPPLRLAEDRAQVGG